MAKIRLIVLLYITFVLSGWVIFVSMKIPAASVPDERQHPVPIRTNAVRREEYVSACLLVKDDNPFLVEWVAFHAHVLPLGALIVAVDPKSRTSPKIVIERWQKRGMEVHVWSDTDYMSTEERLHQSKIVNQTFGDTPGFSEGLLEHRVRQRIFYYKCMQKLQDEGHAWALLIDSDEYLHINYDTVNAFGLKAPPIEEPGSVLTFLREQSKKLGTNLSKSCIQIPRIRYGSTESDLTSIQESLPVGMNASNFHTLRWQTHAHPDDYAVNKISKTLINLQHLEGNKLDIVTSIHRPIRELCGHRGLHVRTNQHVLRIAHYLGTWEQFSYRDDPRKGLERHHTKYKKEAAVSGGMDTYIQAWIKGFIAKRGVKEAMKLLQGAGELVPLP